jgi:hypothetical protein
MPRRARADGGRATQGARETASRPGSVSEGVAAVLGVPTASGKPRKYRNVPQQADGYTFDSTKERDRYWELKRLEMSGDICCLEVHPRFPLVIHGQDCGVYEADFAYLDGSHDGDRVIEDVKSAATRKLPTYRLKARMVWALYGLRIREV